MGGSIRVPWISRRLPSSTQTRSTSVWAPASRSVRLPRIGFGQGSFKTTSIGLHQDDRCGDQWVRTGGSRLDLGANGGF